ncbi:MAG: antibiotic biosynthesis monooxygenase [Proteobacteria bacterium]|nr:antibiotic biosynthesis monooxygenase [Pseudomonadota bacterium]MCH8323238.1 antibiotic biosynthesis monooxygenase [Pseudomonadota bacterium]
MTGFDRHPDGPYYAVIFTTKRTGGGDREYGEMAEAMARLSEKQPGYLGIESVRGEDGLGITVSYWRDQASIKAWKALAEHLIAQKSGRERWYQWYNLRIAKVERGYSFKK